MKADEFREMGQEQLTLTLKDLQDSLFRLRFQAQTEKLEAPSEIRKSKRDIARIKTILHERQIGIRSTPTPEQAAAVPAAAPATSDMDAAEEQQD